VMNVLILNMITKVAMMLMNEMMLTTEDDDDGLPF
jgi:hypothetical protein